MGAAEMEMKMEIKMGGGNLLKSRQTNTDILFSVRPCSSQTLVWCGLTAAEQHAAVRRCKQRPGTDG